MTLWGEVLMAGEDVVTLADLIVRPAWMTDAACAEAGELPWVPAAGVSPILLARMRATCAGCVVQTECLAYAVENGEEGFWGGTSSRQRRHRPLAA